MSAISPEKPNNHSENFDELPEQIEHEMKMNHIWFSEGQRLGNLYSGILSETMDKNVALEIVRMHMYAYYTVKQNSQNDQSV